MIPEPSRTGTAPFGEWQTWYRVTGDLSSPMTPLVVIHGGPGCTHDYVLAIAELARSGRPVIHYDQVGAGRSTHLPDRGGDFWTVDLFLAELDNLLAFLGVQDRYHLLGQSWGGMLGAEHGIRQPAGLKALVISNSPASMDLWCAAANELKATSSARSSPSALRRMAIGKAGLARAGNTSIVAVNETPPQVKCTAGTTGMGSFAMSMPSSKQVA